MTLFLDISLFCLLWYISLQDIREYRIPDYSILALVTLLTVRAVKPPVSPLEMGSAGLTLFSMLLLKTGGDRFARKTSFGWGDVKLFTALSLAIPFKTLPLFYIMSGLAALVLFMGINSKRLPFSPVISLVWLSLTYLQDYMLPKQLLSLLQGL